MEELTPFERLTWPARTERLLIRPLTGDDVPALFAIRRQAEVARWMTASPDDYAEFALAFSEPARTDCTLVMLRNDVLIGDLYLAVSDAWAQKEVAERAKRTQAEIGWCVDPAYAGQGYASEGAAELLRLCFDGLKLRRVTAGAFAANAASIRVMEKIGMTVEGLGRQDSLHRDLGWVDGISAAVLADDWRAGP
jgi:RimJ/RimL family protein N-acetyltransferase